jgi:hypothetical protein
MYIFIQQLQPEHKQEEENNIREKERERQENKTKIKKGEQRTKQKNPIANRPLMKSCIFNKKIFD